MASSDRPAPGTQFPQDPPITASFTQATQIQSYVPPSAWTTEAVLDLHAKQERVAVMNIQSLDLQRGREHRLAWGGLVLIAGIIGFGAYLLTINNPMGKDIIGGTVIFLAGYLAGQGKQGQK